MKCPYCNKDMKSGFVRPLGPGGICWVSEKSEWSAPRSDADFLQIGNGFSSDRKSSLAESGQCSVVQM